MGVVYKAFHEGLNRDAAVKTLLPKKATDAEMRRRLRAEAQAQAHLEPHGNVVSVYDLLEEDPDLFIAMEYVEGQTLKEFLHARSQPAMSLAEAMAIFEQILTALEFVHGNGVIHRDVKPSNVMVSGGRVKLMDFGIALMADMPRQTTSMIGTPQYMSPEQFEPSSKIDHRTDIYSAGIVLFEMLAGRRLFKEKAWFAAMQERLLPPPDLKSLVPHLPSGVCDVVAIALRRSPDDRFKSIAAFHTALAEGVSGLLPIAPEREEEIVTVPQNPAPPPLPELAPQPTPGETSHTTLVWTVSLTVVILSIVAGIALLLKHSPPPVKTAVRTVFVPLPAKEQPARAAEPPPALAPVRATQPEKVFPFKNERPVASPVASNEENQEAQRREIARHRADIEEAFKRADASLAAENFDAVQAELEAIAETVRPYPNDLWQEADGVRRFTNRLNDARVVAKTRDVESAMWQGRLTLIQQQMDSNHFPEAETLAKVLIADPQAPQHVVSRARELLQEAKDRFSNMFKGAVMGETKNTIRKPSSPPRN
jgi:serine/threonine protein kinase